MKLRGWVVLGVLSAFTLTGCASTEWEDRYNELYDDMIDVTAERDQAQNDLIDSLQREESLQQQVDLTKNQDGDLRAQAEEAAARAREYAEALAAAEDELGILRSQTPGPGPDTTAELRAIQAKLDEFLARGFDGRVNEDGNIEITLPSDVTFGSGKAQLTSEGQQSLRSLAPSLNGDYARYQIRV